ncbi:hypothetical protein T08_400 [Trichinella sp. T8]|nr:hypothetical protein T08_400 [Trichinella sp. T8]
MFCIIFPRKSWFRTRESGIKAFSPDQYQLQIFHFIMQYLICCRISIYLLLQIYRSLMKKKIFCILLNRENVCYISFEETENSFEALNKISWKKKQQHQHYCAIWIEKVD